MLPFTVVAGVCSLTATVSVAAQPLEVPVTFLTRTESIPLPLSLLDTRIEDNGKPGAQLGLDDNNTTGSFLNQHYSVNEIEVAEDGDVVAAFKQARGSDPLVVLADLKADDLLAIADADPDTLILNIRAQDDRLRNEDCRANILHVAPSRAMLTDGLAQYLAWKRWNKLALITGRYEQDKAWAASFRRAAKRFGLKLVEEKDWTFDPGARRTDSGHHTAQQEIPAFTQFDDHDILVVADEYDEFGEYLAYRGYLPRPLAGTQGLHASAWHRSHEQWGATQIQRRFEKIAKRTMTERDYAAWAAMRSIGEAVTRSKSAQPMQIRQSILADKFRLAAFKGVPLTYRKWNGQLRQPVLVVAPRILVTVSPQKEYLHEFSPLDTLGYDRPESGCKDFAE